MASNETEFKQEHGAFDVDVYVKVKGRLNGDVVEARKIETLSLPKIEYIGEIKELPDTDDLTGLWGIGRLTFLVTPQTELKDGGGGDHLSAADDGDDNHHDDESFAVGVWVKVEGRARANGIYIADEIRILHKD
jgi:hypothetical protein